MSRPDIFGLKIAELVDKEMQRAKGSFPITLTTVRFGARDPLNPTAGRTKIETAYTCRGFYDTRSRRSEGGVEIPVGVFVIFGASLPAGVEPQPGDRITSAAEGGKTFVIQPSGGSAGSAVRRDPAGATYECEVGP